MTQVSPLLAPTNDARLEWTAIGIGLAGHYAAESQMVRITTTTYWHRPFRGVYLIVNTPGWFIHEARAGNILFLSGVSGDSYSRDEHDRLERIGQLERHRLDFLLPIGNLLSVTVSRRCILSVCGDREAVVAALAGDGCPHPRPPFDATFIGLQQR
jgi:hypothetical protein